MWKRGGRPFHQHDPPARYASRAAAVEPAGPPPTTMTSHLWFPSPVISQQPRSSNHDENVSISPLPADLGTAVATGGDTFRAPNMMKAAPCGASQNSVARSEVQPLCRYGKTSDKASGDYAANHRGRARFWRDKPLTLHEFGV